ncbi:biotin transporter BioY [Microbacteriaceae bacterium VKM Ac-2854]|nr:biotin transporter BioY [Microbacteriaceae bacterium VKM Ac-2854]
MSTFTLAPSRPVLVDRLFARSLTTDIVAVVAGAAFVAGFAQLYVPMFPVPITGQTLAVLLVGASLGALRGGLALGLYALVGIVGLPVFTEGKGGWAAFTSPSGGYIVGFVLAAIVTGWLAQRAWDRKVLGALVAFLAGTVVMYAVGLPWLSLALGNLGIENGLGATLQAGLVPFLIGDAIKILIAAAVLPASWKLLSLRKR